MEFGQIEAFERAAREGSFTRAAKSLDLTQPAVSTRITTLEAELGGQLFERGGRELRLTPLGKHFLPYAQRLLAVYDEARQAARHFQSGRAGQVKLAAPTPFLLSFLVETLPNFRKRYPMIDILIRERNKTLIFDLIRDGTVTLGLVNSPVFDRGMAQLAHFRDPIRVVAAPGHSLAEYAGALIPMRAVYETTIFRVSMFPQMTAFIDEVAEHGRSGSGGAIVAVPMVMALRLVMLGQGISFLPESYVKNAIEAGDLITLNIEDMPSLFSEPVLISHRDRTLDEAHRTFIDVLKRDWRHLLIHA